MLHVPPFEQAAADADRLHIVWHLPLMQTEPGWQLSGATEQSAPTASVWPAAQSQTVASVFPTPVRPATKTQLNPSAGELHAAAPEGSQVSTGGEQR